MKKIENIQDFYDRFNYLSQHHGGPCSGMCAPGSSEKFVRHIEQFHPDVKMIVDIGAGTGGWATRLRYAGKAVTEFDAHPRDNTVIGGDMHATPFENGQFEGVWANHVFEHSISPIMFLTEMNRILKQGGFMFMALPMPVEPWLSEFDHSSVLGYMQVKSLAEKCKFRIIFYRMWGEGNDDFEKFEQYSDPTQVMQVFILQKDGDL